ncbi:factor Xa inhibitor BuXI-like [Chenopodium quinoa]|uniref:factor Xa inhibitor BuXI-like n=1 Tax=Chenopodium quinoa TaxID=63459 RepID=UPI000B775E53|nr:factor Xa inhibitor BuXI-like [Chenopodium quinoa]
MASFLLPVTAITLLLFVLSPSPSSADLVLDTDGNPLQNGGQYYILPHSKNTGGLIVDGLVKPGQICPAYVGTAHSGEDGMPLEILSQYRVFHLSTSLPLQLTFKPLVPFCGFMPLRWWVAPSDANDQSRIIVGVEGPFKPTYAFFAEKSDAGQDDDDYDDLKECKDVTILDDGRLGVAKDSPFPVTFKKKSTFPFLAANM